MKQIMSYNKFYDGAQKTSYIDRIINNFNNYYSYYKPFESYKFSHSPYQYEQYGIDYKNKYTRNNGNRRTRRNRRRNNRRR